MQMCIVRCGPNSLLGSWCCDWSLLLNVKRKKRMQFGQDLMLAYTRLKPVLSVLVEDYVYIFKSE